MGQSFCEEKLKFFWKTNQLTKRKSNLGGTFKSCEQCSFPTLVYEFVGGRFVKEWTSKFIRRTLHGHPVPGRRGRQSNFTRGGYAILRKNSLRLWLRSLRPYEGSFWEDGLYGSGARGWYGLGADTDLKEGTAWKSWLELSSRLEVCNCNEIPLCWGHLIDTYRYVLIVDTSIMPHKKKSTWFPSQTSANKSYCEIFFSFLHINQFLVCSFWAPFHTMIRCWETFDHGIWEWFGVI